MTGDGCCVQCSQENPAQLPTERGLEHSVGLSSNFVWSWLYCLVFDDGHGVKVGIELFTSDFIVYLINVLLK